MSGKTGVKPSVQPYREFGGPVRLHRPFTVCEKRHMTPIEPWKCSIWLCILIEEGSDRVHIRSRSDVRLREGGLCERQRRGPRFQDHMRTSADPLFPDASSIEIVSTLILCCHLLSCALSLSGHQYLRACRCIGSSNHVKTRAELIHQFFDCLRGQLTSVENCREAKMVTTLLRHPHMQQHGDSSMLRLSLWNSQA